jgi:hypothetical protein
MKDDDLILARYRQGILGGEAWANAALRDGVPISARQEELRDEAAAYTMSTRAARSLRAYTLGLARGLRHGAWGSF